MTPINTDQTASLVSRLLVKGDRLAIEQGRLHLEAASGKPVADWLESHHELLVIEILKQTGIDALIYKDCSTDKYGPKKAGGVTLQFHSLLTNANRYAIFNADLTRTRNSKGGKAGSLLPNGQFRLRDGSSFKTFWLSALDKPRRWSSLHDYMGKLKGILFYGDLTLGKPNRIVATSIKAINLSHQQLLEAFKVTGMQDKRRTDSRQKPDNYQTRTPDNQTEQSLIPQGLQPDSTTGAYNYGLRYQGSADIRGNVIALSPSKKPIDQTTDEWLADYS